MDIFASIFGSLLTRWEKRSAAARDGVAVDFLEIQPYLTFVCQFILDRSHPSVHPVPVASLQAGFVGNALLLPERIDVAPSKTQNLQIYLHLTLAAAAMRRSGMQSRYATGTELEYCLEAAYHAPLVNALLERDLPFLADLQADIGQFMGAMQADLDEPTRRLGAVILSQLHGRNQTSGIIGADNQDLGDFCSPWSRTFKANRKLPSALALLFPHLPKRSQQIIAGMPTPATLHNSSDEKPKTELKKKGTTAPEYVDLEKEKEQGNPVTHSFEKLETADEYHGGYRLDSGDDELQDHLQALSEVDLRQVTRGGEAAQSIFQADLPGQALDPGREEDAIGHEVRLPEWFGHKGIYRADYCTLKVHGLSPSPLNEPASGFRQHLESTYGLEVSRWKKQLEAMRNIPHWIPRQSDGAEIDLDAFVRTAPEILMQRNPDNRFYMRRRVQQRACEISILVDQSQSADAWVANRRVIDVCVEAIGLIGLLLQDSGDDITIATTWSNTRKDCHLQILKGHDTPWDHYFAVARSISPQGYTRLGPALRYTTQTLAKSQARQKILLLLTDGKPTDLDGYEGSHGIDDIRQACREAQKAGIYTMAYAIESSARHYFPKMFERFEFMADPAKLPEFLFRLISQAFYGSIG